MFSTGSVGQSGAVVNLTGTAGRTALGSGVQTINVVFPVVRANTLYEVFCSFSNAVDIQPIFLQYVVTAMSTTGFTVIFNAPTDTANYSLMWSAIYDA